MLRNQKASVRFITRVGVMVALGVVMKMFFSPMIGTGIRLNTYGAPIAVVGILFGPVAGGLTGYLVDLLYSLYYGWGVVPNFFTVSSIMWGVIPGLFFFRRSKTLRKVVLVIFLTGLSELIFNTLGLYVFTTNGFGTVDFLLANLPWRIALMLVMVPVNVYIVDVIYDRVIHTELLLIKQQSFMYM